ncbi:hypothetical protein F5888DRAFT_1695681, partial [Russula emetica]
VLLNTALHDYKDKTGSSRVDHPFAKQFQYDSVEFITTILKEQTRIFRELRDRGKLLNTLKRLVDVLCSPFFTTVLDKGIDLLPFPPARAIFAGIRILLTTAKDISTSYDALVDLFASFENFLNRLSIYTKIPPTALTNVLVKIIVVRWIAWLRSHKTTPARLLTLSSFLASHHTLPLLLYPLKTLPYSPLRLNISFILRLILARSSSIHGVTCHAPRK